jgi:hypothetical protein
MVCTDQLSVSSTKGQLAVGKIFGARRETQRTMSELGQQGSVAVNTCSLGQRLHKPLDMPRGRQHRQSRKQSDLDPVLVPDHYRSMDHMAATGLRGD